MSSLPGTAMGQGGSGDGNASSAMAIYEADKPFSMFGKKKSTYKKVHRFVSFGLANVWLTRNVAAAAPQPAEVQRIITTALAEIPVSKPYLYLNPSEFALIPEGSYVSEVRVNVTHRGNRIAFETASTASSLATLNQIQNMQVSVGLNKTGWGNTRSFSGFTDDGMVPSGISIEIIAIKRI